MSDRPPSPFELHRAFARINEPTIKRVLDNYRTAYSLGYRKGQSGPSGAKATGHTDPTGDTVADKEAIRRLVAKVGTRLQQAADLLDTCDEELSALTERKGYEPTRHRAGEVDPEEVQAGMRGLHRMTGRRKASGNT